MNRVVAYVLTICLFTPSLLWANNEVKEALTLQGKGTMTWFIFDLYTARLYTKDQEDLYADDVYLELSYKRNFNGKDIADRSVSEMIDIGVDENTAEGYRDLMREIFPDVNGKTSLSAHFVPGNGITFYKNGKKKIGHDPRDAFGKHFLGIWLSPNTNAPKLRKKLLGK